MRLSVIICTHNPRYDYLRRTLDALKGQNLPNDQWELLLIDNASAEPLAGRFDLSWHPNARLTSEAELGLTAARLRGICEARGDLLVFVDDDNILEPDYFSTCVRYSDSLPWLGCFGAGIIEPVYEEYPATDLLPYVEMLALRNIEGNYWSNVPDDPWIPWGAGLVVRANVAQAHHHRLTQSETRRILGRKGSSLNSCEDDDFSWTACGMGYGKGITSELRIAHLISTNRIQIDYLLALAEGHSYSRAMLRWVNSGTIPHPEATSKLTDIWRSVTSGSVSHFLMHASRMWSQRRTPTTDSLIRMAKNSGVNRACRDILLAQAQS